MANRISLDALTGMRFLAAAAVVVHHAIGHFPEVRALNLPLGNASVSFFFVLSGFILTYAYEGRLRTFSDIRSFWFTRWARIWPLHLVCWIYAISVTSLGFYYLPGNRELLAKAVCQLFLIQSWIPIYRWPFSFNDVSWSISDEAFFYLIFPLLFVLSFRRFAWAVSALLAVVLVTVGMVQSLQRLEMLPDWFDPVCFTHLNPFIRSYDFLMGMLAGRIFLASRIRHRPIGFWVSTMHETLAIALTVLVWWFAIKSHTLYLIKQSPYAGPVIKTFVEFSGLAICFAYMVYVFGRTQGLWARLAGFPLMVYLGEISYSLYLCHALVIKTLKKTAPQTMLDGGMLQVLGLVFTISILSSILLYQLVELPAKAGLLALYRGEVRKSVSEVIYLWRKFWIAPLGWVATALGLATWFYVRSLS
jgi:peptidoglycan/LPS O-acetylase OafA/YrhL